MSTGATVLPAALPRGRGPPGHLPFIDSVQRLQAQKLPVIQAKGLELEHFRPLVPARLWQHLRWDSEEV